MERYVVIYENEREDTTDTDLIKRHVEHLKELQAQKILLSCGPLQGSGKALLIFEANSKEEVEHKVQKDPFITCKWYKNYHIYKWLDKKIMEEL